MSHHFQPELCIGIGERSHFFTLRMSHPNYIPGDGPHGNAVVNGVYQGTVSKGWHHVQNLSQNADEAIAKAHEISKEIGVPLVSTSAAQLGEQLDSIKRATASEIKEREERARRNEERFAAAQTAQTELAMEAVAAGYVPFGRNAGAKIENLEPGYITWLLDKRDELEGWVRGMADYVHEHMEWAHPWPTKPGHVGTVGKRLKGLKVRVAKTIPYETQYGGGWIIIATTEDGLKVKQFCSGALWAEPGDTAVIDGTVKKHDQYKGEDETILQRVKCHERTPYGAPEIVHHRATVAEALARIDAYYVAAQIPVPDSTDIIDLRETIAAGGTIRPHHLERLMTWTPDFAPHLWWALWSASSEITANP